LNEKNKFKMRITEKNGVYFTESNLDFLESIKVINHKLDGIFGHAMLKNLSDLKADMASFALSNNCNIIHCFKYKQKQRVSIRQFFGTDDTYWEGSGVCSKISLKELEKIK